MSFIPPISHPPGRPFGEPTPSKGTTETELGEGGEHRRQLAEAHPRRPWWKRIFRKERNA